MPCGYKNKCVIIIICSRKHVNTIRRRSFFNFLNAKLYISESGAEVASQKASVARVLDFSMYVVVKTDVLDSCHDQLLSLLKTDTSEDQSEDTDILQAIGF